MIVAGVMKMLHGSKRFAKQNGHIVYLLGCDACTVEPRRFALKTLLNLPCTPPEVAEGRTHANETLHQGGLRFADSRASSPKLGDLCLKDITAQRVQAMVARTSDTFETLLPQIRPSSLGFERQTMNTQWRRNMLFSVLTNTLPP